jgi:hypothetical protein
MVIRTGVILLLLPGGGTADLRRDTEPVPAEVQADAERWLAQQHDPEFEPAPWWQPGDQIICSDCGIELNPETAIPRASGKSMMPICAQCAATRRVLDELLD